MNKLKIIALTMAFIMNFSVIYADDTEIIEQITDTNKVYTLSLSDAINIATENNPQLNACLIKKDNYKTQLSAAKINKGNAKDNRVTTTAGYEMVYVRKGYYVESFESALKLVDYEYNQIESKIAYNVTQKYYNLKNCEKLMQITQNSYNLVSESYNNAKLSFELGLISQNDLDNTELSLKRAEAAVTQYRNNLDIAKEDFKIALRKNDENCDFVLTSNIVCEEYSSNVKEDLINAENNRYDILGLESNYELAKKYWEYTGLPENTATYMSAYSNYITADYNYHNNKALILLGVRSSYNSIITAKDNMTISEANLKLANDKYNIAKVQLELGMITNSELSATLNSVSQAEIEYENAKLNYNLAVEKYKYEISIGL